MATGRTSRSRKSDAWWSFNFLCLQFEQFTALATPVVLQPGWHPQDDDIQKTADDQPEKENPCQKQGCGFQKEIDHVSDHSGHLEDWQVHGNDHRADNQADKNDDCGFQQAAQCIHSVADFLFIGFRDLGKHGIQ